MKTLSFLLLAVVAATAVTLLAGIAAGATLILASALAPIVVQDYTRSARRLKLPATVALGTRVERFGLAA